VTSHPVPENHGQWWLCAGRWKNLHAIAGELLTGEQMRAAIDHAEPIVLPAACGLERPWVMPGMGSRLGLRRCERCCRALGIPLGYGTPANEASLKETL
jgi:hypothetical protein